MEFGLQGDRSPTCTLSQSGYGGNAGNLIFATICQTAHSKSHTSSFFVCALRLEREASVIALIFRLATDIMTHSRLSLGYWTLSEIIPASKHAADCSLSTLSNLTTHSSDR